MHKVELYMNGDVIITGYPTKCWEMLIPPGSVDLRFNKLHYLAYECDMEFMVTYNEETPMDSACGHTMKLHEFSEISEIHECWMWHRTMRLEFVDVQTVTNSMDYCVDIPPASYKGRPMPTVEVRVSHPDPILGGSTTQQWSGPCIPVPFDTIADLHYKGAGGIHALPEPSHVCTGARLHGQGMFWD